MMILAYDYPLLGLFWTILFVVLWMAWLLLLFNILRDIFRSDMGGASKALWTFFVLVLPLLGTLLYLVVHGSSMTQREINAAAATEQAFQSYIRSAAGSSTSAADEIAKLAELRAQGHLTDAEFEQQKARALA